MINNKKTILMTTVLLAIVLIGIGTIAYFRRTVNGDITGQAGNLVLIVNEADAVLNETFSVTLECSENENFIMPDDKGVFNLNIDSTGSSDDVEATITILRTNLPENLKFYLDEGYTKELTTRKFLIEKSNDMTLMVPVYWFWDGSVDDEDDSNFINTEIIANISVSASIFTPFVKTLINNATLDTNVDFGLRASETNGIGLMMRDRTQNDEYPIVYYRGDVNNNNVIYAGYCWLIVRTTETGGIKLIYNGTPYENNDGTLSCNNYSNVTVEGVNSGVGPLAVQIIPGMYNPYYEEAFINRTRSDFNERYDSPVYVGYMYNDVDYTYSKATLTTDYVTHLSNNNIDGETGRHIQNLKDSTIKGVVDAWYEANIKGTIAENLLEDTVWCADRSVTSTTYSLENYANSTEKKFYFSAYTRLKEPLWDENGNFIIPATPIEPSLSCPREMDKFTVDPANGNGDLTYPISMLTADEIALAGNVFGTGFDLVTTYLTLPNDDWDEFWTLSPGSFWDDIATVFCVSIGLNDSGGEEFIPGVRPSVSLSLEAQLQGGDGSFKTPYNFDVE